MRLASIATLISGLAVTLGPAVAASASGGTCEKDASGIPYIVVDPNGPSDAPDRAASMFEALARLPPSGPRVIWLRGGVHRLHSSLILDRAAEGLTIAACPGETPVLERDDGDKATPTLVVSNTRNVSLLNLTMIGPSAVQLRLEAATGSMIEGNVFSRPGTAILLTGASGNMIRRNLVVDAATAGIEMRDGSDRNLVTDNIIDGVAATETHGGGIFLHGASDNRILRNVVQNTGGFGIGVLNWDDATVNAGDIVRCNLLRDTVLNSEDSGAIYVLGRSEDDTKIAIEGNIIDGFGGSGAHTIGIYLDDSTSGARVTRNVLRHTGTYAVQIHGGSHNRIENNLIDLGSGASAAVLFQAAPADTHPSNVQDGNVVSRNIIVSAGAEPRSYDWIEGGKPRIAGNFYATVGDPAWRWTGPTEDSTPMFVDGAIARDPARDRYAAIQAIATAIGFIPIDWSRSGMECQADDARPMTGATGGGDQ